VPAALHGVTARPDGEPPLETIPAIG